jgi:1,2-diacylglycerol 3-beta-glucosyltransferase
VILLDNGLIINVDIIIIFFIILFVYYTILYFISRHSTLNKSSNNRTVDLNEWGYVILIPAHNEALVIKETVLKSQNLPGKTHIVVVDDGSTDKTNALVKDMLNDRLHLITRKYPNAKKGKGEALNFAYQWVIDQKSVWFNNIPDEKIIVTVLDADGHLDENLINDIASFLNVNTKTGGIQVPVSIHHSKQYIRLLMQDIEFIGFSYFVQKARHFFSSVGLGGNGQFVRISALKTLGDRPWSRALSEDLDLGLRLLQKGSRLGFCSTGFVHQQGLTNINALLKQRTRWIQGHYQAWVHLVGIWKSDLNLITKIDTSLYLLLVSTVWIVLINMLLNVFAIFGIVTPTSSIVNSMYVFSPILAKVIQLLLSFGITILFIISYKQHGKTRIKPYQWFGVILLFYLYGFIWIYATIAAFFRIILRKVNWEKTTREIITENS